MRFRPGPGVPAAASTAISGTAESPPTGRPLASNWGGPYEPAIDRSRARPDRGAQEADPMRWGVLAVAGLVFGGDCLLTFAGVV